MLDFDPVEAFNLILKRLDEIIEQLTRIANAQERSKDRK